MPKLRRIISVLSTRLIERSCQVITISPLSLATANEYRRRSISTVNILHRKNMMKSLVICFLVLCKYIFDITLFQEDTFTPAINIRLDVVNFKGQSWFSLTNHLVKQSQMVNYSFVYKRFKLPFKFRFNPLGNWPEVHQVMVI